jgi:hypothetical protein
MVQRHHVEIERHNLAPRGQKPHWHTCVTLSVTILGEEVVLVLDAEEERARRAPHTFAITK